MNKHLLFGATSVALLMSLSLSISHPTLSSAAETREACVAQPKKRSWNPFSKSFWQGGNAGSTSRGGGSRAPAHSARVTAGANVRLADVYGGALPIKQGSVTNVNGMSMRTGVASRFGQGVGNPGGRSAFTNENLKTIGAGSGRLHAYCALRINAAAFSKTWANREILVVNGNRAIVCRLADKGPYTKGRIIDMSKATADAVGITRKQGIGRVQISLAKPGTPVGVPFYIQ